MNFLGWMAALFLLVAGCGSTGGDGELIAVSSDRDGDWDIVVVDLDRGVAWPLSFNRGFDWGPKWSPDGSRLAFASDFVNGEVQEVLLFDEGPTSATSQEITGHQGIVVMAADGSDAERITNSPSTDSSPSWSPDGTRLAFASDRGGNLDVYVMDVDGSNVVQLTDHPGTDSEPVWSPDGAQLAFASNRAGPTEVYLMDRYGEGLKRLGVQGMPSDWLSAGDADYGGFNPKRE